jgi:hypothetical protein
MPFLNIFYDVVASGKSGSAGIPWIGKALLSLKQYIF